MDDVTNFWVFTILFALIGFFLSRFLCNCYPGYNSYYLYSKKSNPQELLPIIKIDPNNV